MSTLDVAAVIAKIDPCIDRMEKALDKIDLFQSKIAKLPGAEFDLLKELEVSRDLMNECMKKTSSDRTKLEDVFGGDCIRIRRILNIFDILEEKPLSSMNRNDQRLKGGQDACDSVIKVLEDMGYGWLLRSKVTYAGKTGLPFTGNAFTVGQAIDPIMPQASSADFQKFKINKDLPPGLNFDSSTGEISGTPSAESPPTEYTVTCEGSGKPVECKLLITVNPKPVIAPGKDGFVYAPPTKSYTIEVESPVWEPRLTGGDPPDEFSIIPALPEGLSLNPKTGVISGTPSVLLDLSPYTVTAKNKGGATHCKIALEVNPNHSGSIVEQIIACTTPEELVAFQEEMEAERKNNKKPFNWMIWMVHRAHLNDPTLTKFDFTNLQMPTGVQEPLISPKLAVAMAANNQIQELLLPSTNFQTPEAVVLAQSLPQNTKIRILNIDSNQLQPLAMEMLCRGIGANQTLEQFRCNNCASGKLVFEAVAVMVKSNTHLVKVGMEIKDPEVLRKVNNQISSNTDEARKARVAAAKAAKEAAEGGYPAKP